MIAASIEPTAQVRPHMNTKLMQNTVVLLLRLLGLAMCLYAIVAFVWILTSGLGGLGTLGQFLLAYFVMGLLVIFLARWTVILLSWDFDGQ